MHDPPVAPSPALAAIVAPNDAENAVHRAFARARSWRPPPHWSIPDWRDELWSVLHCAAASARSDYDPTRAVPLCAHIYMRATSAAWTRYRQEWSYYHAAIELRASVEPTVMPFHQTDTDETIRYFVTRALDQLPAEDQLLVRQLFWNRTREKRVASMLAVSQQEVSRRKGRVLRLLRRTLHGYATLLLSQLGSLFLAILDALDVIDVFPDVDYFL